MIVLAERRSAGAGFGCRRFRSGLPGLRASRLASVPLTLRPRIEPLPPPLSELDPHSLLLRCHLDALNKQVNLSSILVV